MFKSTMCLFQFLDDTGQRSEPFVIDPNKFPERVRGYNDEMLENMLVLVLADCVADDKGGYDVLGVSRFPIVSARFFCHLASSDEVHRSFSDDQVAQEFGNTE